MALSYRHTGSIGDIIMGVPAIRAMIRDHGGPANLYLHINVPDVRYPGAVHPAGRFRMNEAGARALIPLLSGQPGFGEVKIWAGETINVDLDLFRATGIDFQHGSIGRWYGYAFDVGELKLHEPWLFVPPSDDPIVKDRLVCNWTSRYGNPAIKKSFLTKYSPVFLGTPDEFAAFAKEVPNAVYYPTQDFLQVASVIAAARCYVGGQSACWAVAEGLKVPRCLMVCPFAWNVLVEGPGAHDAVGQLGFERNVERLMASKR